MNTLILALCLAQPAPEATEPAPPTSIENVDPSAGVAIPPEGQEVGFVVSSIKWIVSKFKAKEYGPAIAAIIMLLLTIANLIMVRVKQKIRKEIMPHIAIATGIGVAMAANLAGIAAGASVMDWLTAVGQGLLLGMAAIGGWEWIGKKLFAKWLKKDDPEVIS